ncbi:MAG: HPP family protein [Magnetospirillum sp.]|nr:HPP family protein [Magnetospirillum sp.]
MPRRFFHRHQAPACIPCWAKAGLGSTAAFVVAALLGDLAGASTIVAPMGASAVLIYGVPESPLSQPAHVIGGHVIAAIVAILSDRYLPHGPWTLAATVSFVIFLLGLLRLTHPPAGATALVVMLTHPGWAFVFTPVLAGAVTLVAVAVIVHWIPPRVIYPLPPPTPIPAEAGADGE